MILVTPSDVARIAPEFKELSVDDSEGGGADQIEDIIKLARSFVSEGAWGARAKYGIILMTAHLLKQLGFGDSSAGASGPVLREKVGDLERQYGALNLSAASEGDQLIAATSYGQQYLMLRKTVFFSPLVT